MSNTTENHGLGLAAGKWEPIFRKASVLTSDLDGAKSQRAKDTKLGGFLAQHTGQEVRVVVAGRSGAARLCMKPGRAKQKFYFFEVRWDDPRAPGAVEATQVNIRLDDGLGILPDGGQEAIATATFAGSQRNTDGGNAETW